jgi:hypothetical protein
MIVKTSDSGATSAAGPHSPVRINISKNKKGPRIRAVRPSGPAFKAFFLARQQLSSITDDRAPEDLSSSKQADSAKKEELSQVIPSPSSPTAFARLPDPAIRVCYHRKLLHRDWIDDQKIDSVNIKNASVVSDAESDEERQCKVTRSPRRARHAVHFDPFVQVVEIPTRDAYSLSDRKNLWTSKSRLRKEASRNKSEFRADASDWRLCKEEEDMVDVGKGELMHPYTYSRLIGCHLPTKEEHPQKDHLDSLRKIRATEKAPKRLLWQPN